MYDKSRKFLVVSVKYFWESHAQVYEESEKNGKFSVIEGGKININKMLIKQNHLNISNVRGLNIK